MELARDLRYAIRGLVRARGFAAVAILTLAVALGANTAIYSIVSAILLRPLPFPQPDQLIAVRASNAGVAELSFSLPNYDDLRAQAKNFEHIAGFDSFSTFLYDGPEPELLSGSSVTANMFPLLGIKPYLGRTFTEAEDREGQPSLVVISYELWQRRFGGDRGILGRQIRVGATPDTVIGVMPPRFTFPLRENERADFWIPMKQDPVSTARGAGWLSAIARLRDGVSLEQGDAELRTISGRMAKEQPGLVFRAQPLHDRLVGEVRPALIVLMCAVGLVLVIGCANVANLLLARAAVRHREISIRAAIGATRGMIVRQLLVESVLLALISGAIGSLLAAWGVEMLVALAPPEIPRLHAITVDANVLLFTLGLSVLTGIVFGLTPALSASKTNLVEALKEGSRGSTEGRRGNRVRNTLVVAEIALSVILLAGAGLLLRSFLQLTGIDPGFDFRNGVTMDVPIRSAVFPGDDGVVQYYRRALEELRAIPGVTSVGGANYLPLGGDETTLSYAVVGRPAPPPGQSPSASFVYVTPGYFDVMRMSILRGRAITEHDGPKAPPAVVISESLARQQFPKSDPIGQQLDLDDGRGIRTIVGVVRDVRVLSLTDVPRPTYYVSVLQAPMRRMQFVVRSPNAASLGSSVRAALRKLDREQPIYALRTLEEIRSQSLEGRRFMLVLIGMLASLALALAAVGIYSIMSYSVTQRTSEIGIRMSLGAEARDIFRLIVGHAVRLVLIGLVSGVVIALIATRVMTSLLFGITATDPVTFASICAVIGGIALLASYLPASRATRVDPLVAIRSE
ncbi:MAG TPA: ABC transporter permease [Thermoanaerobaculia bacterium]